MFQVCSHNAKWNLKLSLYIVLACASAKGARKLGDPGAATWENFLFLNSLERYFTYFIGGGLTKSYYHKMVTHCRQYSQLAYCISGLGISCEAIFLFYVVYKRCNSYKYLITHAIRPVIKILVFLGSRESGWQWSPENVLFCKV